MAKLWPLLAILAAALAVFVLMSGEERGGEYEVSEDDPLSTEKRKDPKLLGSEGAGPRPKTPTTRPERERTEAERAAEEQRLFLEGIVVAAEGGAPIANALLWREPASEPCPRLPSSLRRPDSPLRELLRSGLPLDLESVKLLPLSSGTGPDGRFRWMGATRLRSLWSGEDIFIEAPGYVGGVLCKPAVGSNVTIRLQTALKLPVTVTDRHGRPIESAYLKVKPAEGTEALPGHAGRGVSDRHGRAEIDGLLPGDILLVVDHPEWMPHTIGPIDPAATGPVEVKLAPALRLTFEIRSDDGSEIRNATLAFETDGEPPHKRLLLLQTVPSGPPSQPLTEVRSAAVRIPTDHRHVRLVVKADGFEPWSPQPEPLPVEGGERTIIASLTRDTSLASVDLRFEDEEGKPVAYTSLGAVPAITRLDGQEMSSGIVLEPGETLHFPALPAGPYLFGIRCPKYAPAEVEMKVIAGEKNEAVLKLQPAARLKVRFTATEQLTVRFRLTRSGQLLLGFPEGGADGEAGTKPLLVRGNEGAVFGGLPPGACVIEVTDPALVAAPRSAQLRAGETTEVEIEVRKR